MNGHDPLSFFGLVFPIPDERAETLRNLQLIIRIRWFLSPFIFLLLFLSSILGFSKQSFFSENQLVVNGINLVVVLFMNLAYALLVRRVKNLAPLVIFQLLIDVVSFSITIYKTGGVSSPFGFLYFMTIFSTSILSHRRATFVIAGIAALLSSALNLLELIRLIPHQDFFSPMTVLNPMDGLGPNNSFVALSRDRAKKLRQSNEVLAKKVDAMLLLYNATRALSTCSTVREVVDYILTELVAFLGLDRALLYLNVRSEYLHLYMVKERPREGGAKEQALNVDIPLREDAGLTARCALARKAFKVDRPEESPFINRELALKIGMNPFALAPLLLREKTVGVLGIDRSYENGCIAEEEFQILQIFANQAAITIGSLMEAGGESTEAGSL